MGKRNITLTIDENIWELAKDSFPSVSSWVENQFRLALDKEDEEGIILNEIQTKENELNVLKDKLCSIREQKSKQKKDSNQFDDAMVSINRINEKAGQVGENQIRKIARHKDIDVHDLIKYCHEVGDLNIVNFYEAPKG